MEQKPHYYPYSVYLKNKYQQKVYKLPVNLPITCPNRITGEGCSFCSDKGTGFEARENFKSVTSQLQENRDHIAKRYKAQKFIAYFQNYTNTYMPLPVFEANMEEAAVFPNVVEISISTRPDCIHRDYLEVLKRIHERFQVEINIELGLQTVNYRTLANINRGHGLAEYIDSVLRIAAYGFTVCTHLILNLPGDSLEDAVESARVISALPTQIVKVHSLYVAKNTSLSQEYERGTIAICEKEEYYERLSAFLANLRPDMAVERLFSRIPEADAVFSNWGCSWWKLADEFQEYCDKIQLYQGIHCDYLHGKALREGGWVIDTESESQNRTD